jgi:dipeptidyl-peptidase-4
MPSYVQRSLVAVDDERGLVYVTALEASPLERHLYRVALDGSGFTRVSTVPGMHGFTLSPDRRYYLDRHSSIETPVSLNLYSTEGKLIEPLKVAREDLLADLQLVLPELLTIPARDSFPIPAMILKPRDFDDTERYPVIFDVYGGPSSPQVSNSWQYAISWWNVLADNGYIVMVMDPRSATGVSKSLEDLVFERIMGDVELNDLLDAVRWTKARPFVDSTRIGITGASGGGTYTILGMTRSHEFKAGIAISALTDVRFYDAFWGETVMKTEAENREGFEHVSLLNSAADLHGRLLIIHGTHDDNVHIQNVWAFVDELVKANKLFEMMLYPERKHGIPDRRHYRSVILDFWKRNL